MKVVYCFRCKHAIPEGAPSRMVDTRLTTGMGKKPMHDECAVNYFQEIRRQSAEGGPKMQGWQQYY